MRAFPFLDANALFTASNYQRHWGGVRLRVDDVAVRITATSSRSQFWEETVTANALQDVRTFDVPASPGRRYRGQSPHERRADLRQRLVRAAVEEFAARGFSNTSVEDIVRSARSSRTGFYMFFDNRAEAMYAALHFCLHELLETTRRAVANAQPDERPIEVAVRALVDCLVADPSAASIILIDGSGTSVEVNALRGRMRLEFGAFLLGLNVSSDQDDAQAVDDALRAAIVGLLFEPMAHLAETGRLAEAPAHIPSLVSALEKHIR